MIDNYRKQIFVDSLKQSGLIELPKWQRVVLDLSGVSDPTLFSLMEEEAYREAAKTQVNPQPFDEPAPADLVGDIYIGGKTLSGFPVNLSRDKLIQGILITGSVGSGKTFTLKNIITSLYHNNYPLSFYADDKDH